jgi:Sulfotransferase family
VAFSRLACARQTWVRRGRLKLGISALRRVSLRQYLATEEDDGNLWLFIHIPKTAGSSLGAEIAREVRPYRNIHVEYDGNGDSHDVRLQKAVDRFIADGQTIQFRSASGHLTMQHALQIRAAFPRTRLVTMLRHPVARVISDFRYQRTPAHPQHKEFIERYPTLSAYAHGEESQDKMFRFMAPDPTMPFAGALSEIEEMLSFVGLVEMYPMSFNVLFRLFSLDLMPKEYRRKTETNEHNVVENSPEIFEMIAQLNPRDVLMFDTFRKLLGARREEWSALRHAAAGAVR